MRICDMHCDVLYKMLQYPNVSFADEEILDVTYNRLVDGNIRLQGFAIFLPEDRVATFDMVQEAIGYFHERLLSQPNMVLVKNKADLAAIQPGQHIGALLTLESAEGLMGSMEYLHTAFESGVRCLGLTWNYANWAADGVLERRGAGLTNKGRQLIGECNEIGMIIDISHLNQAGFWEVMELTKRPIIASHSNTKAVHLHARNLDDDQIEAIIHNKGAIGLTFVPDFLGEEAGITDVLRHLEHVCSLGGETCVGFGSDFDGIDTHVPGLRHPAEYANLLNELQKHYKETQVQQFIWSNWHTFFSRNLPS